MWTEIFLAILMAHLAYLTSERNNIQYRHLQSIAILCIKLFLKKTSNIFSVCLRLNKACEKTLLVSTEKNMFLIHFTASSFYRLYF